MLTDNEGNVYGGDRGGESIGWAPLAAVLAPVGVAIAGAGAKAIINKLAPKKAPPCSFWERLGRVFGGRPNCS